jgi:hypothetical protein
MLHNIYTIGMAQVTAACKEHVHLHTLHCPLAAALNPPLLLGPYPICEGLSQRIPHLLLYVLCSCCALLLEPCK